MMLAAIIALVFVACVHVCAFALCKAASDWRDDDEK